MGERKVVVVGRLRVGGMMVMMRNVEGHSSDDLDRVRLMDAAQLAWVRWLVEGAQWRYRYLGYVGTRDYYRY